MKPFITPGVTASPVTEIARPPDRLSDPAQAWASTAQSARGVQETQGGVRRNRDTFSTRNKHFPVLANLFPFAVYNLPRPLRTTPDDGNDWRKFRVHGGWAMGANTSGTDGANSDSHPEYLGDFSNAYDVWAPNSTNIFYFWLEISGSTSRVLYGPNQAANSYSDADSTPNHAWNTTDPWSTAPVPDGNHVPIAAIFPDPPNLRANIRQYLRTDLSNTAGGNGGSSIKTFSISNVGGNALWDYFGAREILPDGSLSGTITNIAKDWEQRPSIANETWDGTQYDYNYSNDNYRVSTIHGTNNSQTEVCHYRFETGKKIKAGSCQYTGVNIANTDPLWIDLTSRVWQRVYGQNNS